MTPNTATDHIDPRLAVAPLLADAREAQFLLQLLASNDPLHLHFSAPLWSARQLVEVVRDEFGHELAPDSAARCLAELGLPIGAPIGLTRAQQAQLARAVQQHGADRVWWVSEQVVEVPIFALDQRVETAGHRKPQTVLLLANAAGAVALHFCRGLADVAERAEFLRRFALAEPAALLCTPTPQEPYLQATARLAPDIQARLQLLDLRTTDNEDNGLFRAEVMRARSRRLDGEVLLARPLTLNVLVAGFALLLCALLLFAGFGRLARTHSATGTLLPASGVLAVSSEQAGVVERILVQAGEQVRAGQPLLQLAAARADAGGASTDAAIVAELERSLATMHAEANDASARAKLEAERLREAWQHARVLAATIGDQYRVQAAQQASIDQRLKQTEALVEQGVIARVAFQQMQEQALSGRVQLLALARERQAAEAAVDDADGRLAQHPLTVAEQANALTLRRTDLEQRLLQARAAAGSLLRAPRAGRIASITARPGQTLPAGRGAMLLVDEGDPLQAELLLPSSAIGFVRKGQVVQLKVDAFPYQRFGLLAGRISEIAGAAQARRELDQSAPRDDAVYRVLVALDEQSIRAYGQDQTLRTGMTVSADIVLERPRVIAWLLDPIASLRGR